MAFSDTWAAFRANLKVGTVISNWTFHRGETGDPFTVRAISSQEIVVDPPGAQMLQQVRVGDFEAVYSRWNDYTHGRMKRGEFNPLTRYSKYVISLLHWLETQQGGRLP